MQFARPKTQAIKAVRLIHQTSTTRNNKTVSLVRSVATQRIAVSCLTQVCNFLQKKELGDLQSLNKKNAEKFLHSLEETYAQKTINQYRQSIQLLLTATGQLRSGEHLEIVAAKTPTVLGHRAYTEEQCEAIASAQNKKNAFSTQLAFAAGLRAHELFTIRRLNEQPADKRYYADGTLKSLPSKWVGEEASIPYSVIGKGGLIREVHIPVALAQELERRRLATPRHIRDREINYESFYDVAGGNAWSASFNLASNRVLGWSTGAHGLRHSYAQRRMLILQRIYSYEKALETVSQEMGHFRPSITEVYLR